MMCVGCDFARRCQVLQRRGKLSLVFGSVFLAGVDATTTETSLDTRTASSVRDEMVGIMHWGVSPPTLMLRDMHHSVGTYIFDRASKSTMYAITCSILYLFTYTERSQVSYALGENECFFRNC